MKTIASLLGAGGLHLFVGGLAAILRGTLLVDRAARAHACAFAATYRFQSGTRRRDLVLDRGRVRTKKPGQAVPDFEIEIIDPLGAVRSLRRAPGDMIALMVGNKVHTSGNLFFLYRLGYLFGRSRRAARGLSNRLQRVMGTT